MAKSGGISDGPFPRWLMTHQTSLGVKALSSHELRFAAVQYEVVLHRFLARQDSVLTSWDVRYSSHPPPSTSSHLKCLMGGASLKHRL